MMRSSLAQPAPRPTAIDLFAGAGGLSLGLEQAGFDVIAAVEYDPVHAAVHEYNFPNSATICGDISMISGQEILDRTNLQEPERGDLESGDIDLVCGGPPCQGFSMIGKRLVDDERNQLVFHFLRVVSEIRPRYFIMENVPGMATGGHSSILQQLMSELEEVGYKICGEDLTLNERIINAADFGVPQSRKRLFLIGAREDQRSVLYPTPTVRPVPKRRAKSSTVAGDETLPEGPSVWDAIGDIPNLNDFKSLLSRDEVRLSPERLHRMEQEASPYSLRLRGALPDPQDFSYPRVWDPAILTGSMRTVHTQKSIDRFSATTPGETEPISRFYRLDPAGLSNTLRAGTGSERGAFTSARPIHPTRSRVISVREAARLHSFPDWFRFHETKWHGFRQIGNAVAPLVGRSVASQIVKALELEPHRPDTPLTPGDHRLLSLTMGDAVERFDADEGQLPGRRRRSRDSSELARAA